MDLITTVSRLAGRLGAALIALTGVMLSYEVMARYFFVHPTIWAAELSQLCLIWGCLLAMAHVLATRGHITVNAMTNLLPLRGRMVCAAAALLFILAFSGMVAIWGWFIFEDSFTRGRTTGSLLDLPVWISDLSVPTGFALLALQAVRELMGLRSYATDGLGHGAK